MNVLLVSQCTGAALTETRRILDQFSPRCGDRTWLTPITQIGLATLHRLLRKSARRNTAVCCYWVRQNQGSHLLWIVGKLSEFNNEGYVPTNTTRRDIIKKTDENDWHSLMIIIAIARMAALFHDFGKACDFFTTKLKAKNNTSKNPFRHEWVSVRLFQAFVWNDTDEGWLRRLADIDTSKFSPQTIQNEIFTRLKTDPIKALGENATPLETLPPVAKAVCWLILSHHRIPSDGADLSRVPDRVSHLWNQAAHPSVEKDQNACFKFSKGLPINSVSWRKNAAFASKKLLVLLPTIPESPVFDPYLMHHARLCLMLADHIYSSGPAVVKNGDADYPVYANSSAPGVPKQRLDEHLIGVSEQVKRIAFSLPRLGRDLPCLSRHKGFSKRTGDQRFTWQNKAFDLAVGLREHATQRGFFGVNMASTGTGKTLANARIIYGLGDPVRGVRFTVALGLRSLTLQTGREYRRRFGLGDDALAIQVGGGIAIKTLFNRDQDEDSTGRFEDSDGYVCYDGIVPDTSIYGWMLEHPAFTKLLSAPILVTTVDHLAPATESLRGGRQIAPMLRLANSDLILDEPDDFDIDDLPALTRLVHWAGMLGSRILLSSATLPPAIVEGLFSAYLAGRTAYAKHRGIRGVSSSVVCAWFDENERDSSDHAGQDTFSAAHAHFTRKRIRHLAHDKIRRLARIIDFPQPGSVTNPRPDDLARLLAETILNQLPQIHSENASIDPISGARVSFGLIRMANIHPLISVTKLLLEISAPDGFHIHICCYHAKHSLIVRSGIEAMLDSCLDRKDPSKVFQHSQVRDALNGCHEPNQVFLVLASPVAEVGRDHDYDWAIVEPSSMRSIIQLAGRIRRHRPEPWDHDNIYLLERNLRAIRDPGNPAFTKPGFEHKNQLLASHTLKNLLLPGQIQPIDSCPRISAPDHLEPSHNLSDLEHSRLTALMTSRDECGVLPVRLWWESAAHLSGILQNCQPFRKSDGEMHRFFLRPADEPGEPFVFVRLDENKETEQSQLRHPVNVVLGRGMSHWGRVDFEAAIRSLAQEFALPVAEVARRFAWIDLRATEGIQGWNHHEALGFWKYPS